MSKEGKSKRLGSNWALLLQKSGVKGSPREASTSASAKSAKKDGVGGKLSAINLSSKRQTQLLKSSEYVGLDCEMVGLGPSGKQSALARACLVDFVGEII